MDRKMTHSIPEHCIDGIEKLAEGELERAALAHAQTMDPRSGNDGCEPNFVFFQLGHDDPELNKSILLSWIDQLLLLIRQTMRTLLRIA